MKHYAEQYCTLHKRLYAAYVFTFTILKKSARSHARLGVIETPHGIIETPSFVPVATRGSVRMIDSAEIAELGAQVLICNTYHLHLTPGEEIVRAGGGLHTFMRWEKPLFTDSGGFQVFSLGFGRDHGMNKMLKEAREERVEDGDAPKLLKMTEEGVRFRSPITGDELFLDPETSIGIQQILGSDVMFAFDECPSPLATEEYMRTSMDRTHRWATRCLDAKTSKHQALYGIVQGGKYKDMRLESARIIGAMPFDGFGIGGEFGYDKATLGEMLGWVHNELPQSKPRHVLGIGHPEDFPIIAGAGGDTFDCIAPTHYARRGIVFTSEGRLMLAKRELLTDFTPLDPACNCPVCRTYTRAYISHLVRAHELTGLKLATMHNVYYFNNLAAIMRNRIKNDEL